MIFREIHHFTSFMLDMFIFLADSAHELLHKGMLLKYVLFVFVIRYVNN